MVITRRLIILITNETIDVLSDDMSNIRLNSVSHRSWADWIFKALVKKIFYVPEEKSFYIYNGKYFDLDVGNSYLHNLMIELISLLLRIKENEFFDSLGSLSEKILNSLDKKKRIFEETRYIDSVVKSLSKFQDLYKKIDDFDFDRDLLNVQNGVVCLRTGELRSHSPDFLMTKICNVDFKPEYLNKLFSEVAPTVHYVIKTLLGNPVDKPRIFDGNMILNRLTSFMEFCGYSITGETNQRFMCILFGATSSGKSKLIELLNDILGSYAITTQPSTFFNNKNRSEGRHDLLRIRGARLITALEATKEDELDIAGVKQVVGEDTIVARKLFAELEEFRSVGKIWLMTNECPKIDFEPAIYRRLRIIQTFYSTPHGMEDKTLIDKMKNEKEAFFAYLIYAAKRFYDNEGNFYVDDSFKYAKMRQVAKNAPSSTIFCNRYLQVGPYPVSPSVLYQQYTRWCNQNHFRPVSDNALFRTLTKAGFMEAAGTQKRINNYRCYLINPVLYNEQFNPFLESDLVKAMEDYNFFN